MNSAQWRRPGAEFGGTDNLFADQDFWMRSFLTKILMTFFSHRQSFSDFPFHFPDSPYLYCVKCRIWPFLHKKNHYFTKEFLDDTLCFLLCSYFRAHPTTLLLKILGGRMHEASPHLKCFWGNVPPVPLGLSVSLLKTARIRKSWKADDRPADSRNHDSSPQSSLRSPSWFYTSFTSNVTTTPSEAPTDARQSTSGHLRFPPITLFLCYCRYCRFLFCVCVSVLFYSRLGGAGSRRHKGAKGGKLKEPY